MTLSSRARLPRLLLALVVTACSVTLVARYDEVFDRSASSLQHRFDSHLTRLMALPPASDSAAYPASAPFYLAYQVDLRALLLRARSLPRNELTAQQLEAVAASIEEVRATHERRTRLDTAFARVSRDLVNQGWQGVLALELAKQR